MADDIAKIFCPGSIGQMRPPATPPPSPEAGSDFSIDVYKAMESEITHDMLPGSAQNENQGTSFAANSGGSYPLMFIKHLHVFIEEALLYQQGGKINQEAIGAVGTVDKHDEILRDIEYRMRKRLRFPGADKEDAPSEQGNTIRLVCIVATLNAFQFQESRVCWPHRNSTDRQDALRDTIRRLGFEMDLKAASEKDRMDIACALARETARRGLGLVPDALMMETVPSDNQLSAMAWVVHCAEVNNTSC